jgi:hypothetical protein
MIFIYSEYKTNRLTYALKVVFQQVLHVSFKEVSLEEFRSLGGAPKINYSSKNIADSLSISPHPLLFEQDIRMQKLAVEWQNSIPYFFKTSKNSSFQFDLFAAVFYMVSRYEEYHPSFLDEHQRYAAESSLAFQNNFLKLPVVHLWAEALKTAILKTNPNYRFPTQQYKYLNSMDIDSAYAFKGKGFTRFTGGLLKALLQGNTSDLKKRIHYFLFQKDPYDTYSVIEDIQKKYQTKNAYFFLLGDRAQFDKNLSYKSKILEGLIRRLQKNNLVGIHPSYASNSELNKIDIEKKRLEKITNTMIAKSRQHFLKLNLPNTYENLLLNGINNDYSMGFASQVGFRAGICVAFPFFNLKKNEERPLLIHPFQVMDGTLNHYLQLSPQQAVSEIEKIVAQVKTVHGTFVSLWHNSSLSEQGEWKEWTAVYKKLVKIAHKH